MNTLDSGLVSVPITVTPVGDVIDLDGLVHLLLTNAGAVAVTFQLFYYPDGVTPILDNITVPDLAGIAPGAVKLLTLSPQRPGAFSISAFASVGNQNVRRQVFQPKIRRSRSKYEASSP